MTKFEDMKCIPCRGNTPALASEEVQRYLPDVPGWSLVEEKGVPRLQRVFQFKNFAEALAFTNRVGAIAEEEDHHPALLTEWGRVTVTWWTHVANGLHANDFIMAAKTSRLNG